MGRKINTNSTSSIQQILFGGIEPNSDISDSIGLNKPKAHKAKRKKKINAKNIVLPHSRAKLTLYSGYLEKYLAILSVVPAINKVHIFDIFCGTGIYKDGAFGSPIIAYNNILKVDSYLKINHKTSVKDTILYINDLDKNNVAKVNEYLDNKENNPKLNVKYYNLDAQQMLEKVIDLVKKQPYNERNLVFLDPYGYSQIKKEIIIRLMDTKKVEIILFLPASFMHRFKTIVQQEEKKAYESLRKFIYDFFDENHPIRINDNIIDKISVFDFINYLRDAFSLKNTIHSTSFYLQRDSSNYYALFFLTNNLLGLERVIDIKWKIDPSNGQGFRNDDSQVSLFKELQESMALEQSLVKLEKIVLTELYDKSNLSNCELYYIALKNDFRPTHATQVLTRLQAQNRILVLKNDGTKLKKGAFYINNDSFSSKKDIINVSMTV